MVAVMTDFPQIKKRKRGSSRSLVKATSSYVGG